MEVGTGGGFHPLPHPGGAVAPWPEPVLSARGSGLVAALTFDDGPNGGDTMALLDILRARGLRAVFCVVGECADAPGGGALIRRMAAEGHVLANHSTGFADLAGADEEAVRIDLTTALASIRAALGDESAPVPYYRAPNGSWSAAQLAVAVELGMQPLGVDRVIGDWVEQDPVVLAARMRRALRPGDVLVAHDGGGPRAGTVAAVRTVLDERLAAGWRFSLPSGGPADMP